ncbi:MAG TPA: YbjN domain-containing protein [Caulobacteraceae bacterium]|jgi:hypothetical protein
MRHQLAAGLVLAMAAASGARADSFDARRADDVASVVTGHGATGQLAAREDGKTFFEGQAGDVGFAVYFQDCDEAQLCKSLLFTNAWDDAKLTPELVNQWNAWTTWCPAYLDKGGAPNLWLSAPVSARTDASDLGDQVGVWTACLKDFSAFVAAPSKFLADKQDADPTLAGAAPAQPAAAPAPAAPTPAAPRVIADPAPQTVAAAAPAQVIATAAPSDDPPQATPAPAAPVEAAALAAMPKKPAAQQVAQAAQPTPAATVQAAAARSPAAPEPKLTPPPVPSVLPAPPIELPSEKVSPAPTTVAAAAPAPTAPAMPAPTTVAAAASAPAESAPTTVAVAVAGPKPTY